jgi:hypothetical protein
MSPLAATRWLEINSGRHVAVSALAGILKPSLKTFKKVLPPALRRSVAV